MRTFGKGRAISTHYYKNGMHRSDNIDPATGQLRSVTVVDDPGQRSIRRDFERREYSIRRPRHRLRVSESSGPTLAIDIESTDTGERRTMFGREVRRVITVERRQTEGGAIESESRTHGWYLESDSLPPGMRAQPGVLLGAVYGQASPAFKINRRGLVEKGLPVSVTTRMSVRADRHFDRSSEVTELFEGRLDPALFEPPPGFRRVFHFDNFAATWQNRLLMQWEWLQDWFTGLRR